MGQCYSVYIKSKDINEVILKELTKKWSTLFNIKITGDELTDMLESLFGDDASVKQCDSGKYISSAFEASYGWHDRMIQWFTYVSPAFTPDVVMEIEPDEGMTKTYIDNQYRIDTKEMSWEEMCDDDPTLNDWANKIFDAVRLTKQQKCCIKEELGRSRNLDHIEEDYPDMFTDETITELYVAQEKILKIHLRR